MKETGQKSITINDTIIKNIVLGEKFSKDEIDEVIKMCQLENLIRLKGEDFIVNESADNLSGGEKQRISLARVLIRKPDVILLDEPTSALDENTAENFISAFFEFIKKYEMSAIVITHKNDFVKISDMIVDLK
ncbi:MAG: ATP-binding cassette domain-containing protein [Tissierellia bacterium]|nr:ATP-binding cassette domain-containing protein [Tissierellia bacterium]